MTHPLIAPLAKIAALGAGIASLAFLLPVGAPAPVAPVAAAPVAPYCMFDAENLTHVTVAGPSGGVITVAGKRVGELSLVDAIDTDVAVDAGPFDGIQYNVPGPGTIAVDGKVCETT